MVKDNSNGVLDLIFNDNATTALVNQLMQSITFQNSSQLPGEVVELEWDFNDNISPGTTGPAQDDHDNITIEVLDVIETQIATPNTILVNEDEAHPFTSIVSVSHNDNPNEQVTITASVSNGTLTSNPTSGVNIKANDPLAPTQVVLEPADRWP